MSYLANTETNKLKGKNITSLAEVIIYLRDKKLSNIYSLKSKDMAFLLI